MQRHEKLQRVFDHLNVVEIALTYDELVQLIEMLSNQLIYCSLPNNIVTMQMMCTAKKVNSSFPGVKCIRAKGVLNLSAHRKPSGFYQIDGDEIDKDLDIAGEILDN